GRHKRRVQQVDRWGCPAAVPRLCKMRRAHDGLARAVTEDALLVPNRAAGNEQLRMVKGSLFVTHALVGQGLEERHQRNLFIGRQVQWSDVQVQVVHVEVGEVPAAVVELHHLLQRQHTAVVEVGSGQLDVAESGGLERSEEHTS